MELFSILGRWHWYWCKFFKVIPNTARNIWAFIYLLCHLFKQILPAVFGGRFTDGISNNISRRIALFQQNIHRKNNSGAALCHDLIDACQLSKQEGHEALNRSPEYTGESQTFNFEIWMTFGQVQRMTLTFDTHSTSLTHLAECFKRLWDLRLQ